jgi:hypothetical protein
MSKLLRMMTLATILAPYLCTLMSTAFANELTNRSGSGGVSETGYTWGGLGRSFPLHYIAVREAGELREGFRWEQVNSNHLRAWRDASLRTSRLSRYDQQTLVEVIFRSIVDFNSGLSGSDKDEVVRWWSLYLEQGPRERMPDSERCTRGIRAGNRGDVDAGCGLNLVQVSLSAGGSWLARLGVELTDAAPLIHGQSYLQIDAAKTREILVRAGAVIRDANGSPSEPADAVFAVTLVFNRLLLNRSGISENERMALALEWSGLVGRKVNVDSMACSRAINSGRLSETSESCGLAQLGVR